MPTHRFGFTQMPHNFFAANPAMTIREAKQERTHRQHFDHDRSMVVLPSASFPKWKLC